MAEVSIRDSLKALFPDLDDGIINALQQQAQITYIKANECLFSYGDPSYSIYIVQHGRLAVNAPDGHFMAEVDENELIGEFAIFSETRTATVIALRDSCLLKINLEQFKSILYQYPKLMFNLFTTVYQRTTQPLLQRNPKINTIAFLNHGDADASEQFIHQFIEQLEQMGSVYFIASDDLLDKTEQDWFDNELTQSYSPWLAELEKQYDYLVFHISKKNFAMDRWFINQSGLFFVLIDAVSNCQLEHIEHTLNDYISLKKNYCLLMLHQQEKKRFLASRSWLNSVKVHHHFHVRLQNQADIKRVIRFVSARSVGVTFGGGGARSLSQIGVIKALQEAGIPIDRVTSVSMGSIIGSACAQMLSPDEMQAMANQLCQYKPLSGYDFPAFSIFRDTNIDKVYQHMFGEQHIEDLWLPFSCVSADISTNNLVVHDRGLLRKWIKASTAIPGLLPPVIDNQHVHVDGGILENLPVDFLVEQGVSYSIAINVSFIEPLVSTWNYPKKMTGWQYLFNKILPLQTNDMPKMMTVISRSFLAATMKKTQLNTQKVNLCISPPVTDIGLFDFENADKIIDIGYSHTCRVLEEQLRSNQDLLKIMD